MFFVYGGELMSLITFAFSAFNRFHIMALTDPMQILGKKANYKEGSPVETFVSKTGISTLGQIFTTGFAIAAVVTIVGALITLLVVNYPKTVAQTKTKVVHSFLVLVILDGLVLIMNAIVGLVEAGIFGL